MFKRHKRRYEASNKQTNAKNEHTTYLTKTDDPFLRLTSVFSLSLIFHFIFWNKVPLLTTELKEIHPLQISKTTTDQESGLILFYHQKQSHFTRIYMGLPGQNQSPCRPLFQQLLADLDHRVDQEVQGVLSRHWVPYLLLDPADSMKLP